MRPFLTLLLMLICLAGAVALSFTKCDQRPRGNAFDDPDDDR